MIRLLLLLVLGGGLILFAVQNFTLVPLVILGMPTPPLPLAVWVLGAIAAGAVTTLVTASLFKGTRRSVAPRPPRSPQPRPAASRFASGTMPPPVEPASWQPEGPRSSSSGNSASRYADDWESRRSPEAWDDWEGYREPVKATTSPPVPPPSSDWTPRYSPPPSPHQHPTYEPAAPSDGDGPEVWDDWEEEESPSSDRVSPPVPDKEPEQPRRTDFEVRQEPSVRYQSGSLYSYSYRQEQDSPQSSSASDAPENVYDAEYRVLTPPYHPEGETDTASEADWGDEEDGFSEEGRPPSTP